MTMTTKKALDNMLDNYISTVYKAESVKSAREQMYYLFEENENMSDSDLAHLMGDKLFEMHLIELMPHQLDGYYGQLLKGVQEARA